jgi:two-component system phosphate regulon sensor histidine kinase PhoR
MRLVWRITAAYALLILAVTALLGLYLPTTLRAAQLEQLRSNLANEARMVAEVARPAAATGDAAAAQALAQRLGAAAGARVTLIAADGRVLGDSEADPATMESHAGRPEIAPVLSGAEASSSMRHSATVDQDLLYVAVPIRDGDRIVGVVRVARERSGVEREFWRAIAAVLVALALAGALAALLTWAIARRISRPLTELTLAARGIAGGQPPRAPASHGDDEIGELGRAFDDMAARLRETIATLESDRARLTAVLGAMADGVVLLDREGRVIMTNEAAGELLDLRLDAAASRRLIELVHDHELHELAQRTIGARRSQGELVKFAASGRHLRITGTPMSGGAAAALLLVQDVTEIRRAELIRREFVANVSHELKTPIASIKALTETLEDGAMDDPPAARDFLQRMHVEVDGLAQLVQEILDLSRIESGRARMSFAAVLVPDLIAAAVGRLRAQADRAGVALEVVAPPDLPAVRADGARIESAIINLVHNAIKFTPPGGRVEARAERESDAELRIVVADTGVGVPAAELPRLFERFYKSDRSRASSGTGLGLAIVKHVVQAHGGRVGVESRPGTGSTFWFTLPIATQATAPARPERARSR